jgi:GNAT superfamily N-acetyltransferase
VIDAAPIRLAFATKADVAEISAMVGALLNEIMQAIGSAAFHFDIEETTARLHEFIETRKYQVLLARDECDQAVGFLSLYESYALYAEGAFGTVPEFYVAPAWRSRGVGSQLLAFLRAHASERGWTRLELTTPPLPQFDRALAFYIREGFSISGGRKLKLDLA